MDKGLVCECGNDLFWFFWDKARCTCCHNEYKTTLERNVYINPYSESDGEITHHVEYWLRRFNREKQAYDKNWEKSKLTYKREINKV